MRGTAAKFAAARHLQIPRDRLLATRTIRDSFSSCMAVARQYNRGPTGNSAPPGASRCRGRLSECRELAGLGVELCRRSTRSGPSLAGNTADRTMAHRFHQTLSGCDFSGGSGGERVERMERGSGTALSRTLGRHSLWWQCTGLVGSGGARTAPGFPCIGACESRTAPASKLG
jgi:hypothetical protein